MRHVILSLVICGLLLAGSSALIAQAPADPNLLLTVEGQPVLRAELADLLLKNQGYPALIEFVTQRLVQAEIVRQGAGVTPAEVAQEVQRTTERVGGAELLDTVLARRGMTRDDLSRQLELELSLRKLVQKQEIVAITDADVQRLYQQQYGEKLYIQLILVRDEKTAADVLAQIQQGEDFGLQARKYSQDSSTASAAGHLGPVGRGFMTESSAETALFALKQGQVSPAVPSKYGFYIFKLNKRDPAANVPFDQVKDDLKKLALDMKIREKSNLYVEGVRQRAKRLVDDAKIKF